MLDCVRVSAVMLVFGATAWSQGSSSAAGSNQTGNTALDTPSAQGTGDHSALASPVAGAGRPVKTGPVAGEAALDTAGAKGQGDQSALASPVPPLPRGTGIVIGTEVKMTLTQDVSSGSQINGDKVYGTLTSPVRTTTGAMLPSGAKVEGTVVSSARAGLVTSGGILSLQLTRVGGIAVITDVVDFNGKEGHKDVADSAPDKGTEAAVASGTTLDFHVMQDGKATGLVPGVAPANNPGGNQGGANGAAPNPGPGIPQTPVHGATQGVTPH